MERTRGWGPWKVVWLSGCSKHRKPDENCRVCMEGDYSNLWLFNLGTVIFYTLPSMWNAFWNFALRVKPGVKRWHRPRNYRIQ